MRELVSIGLVMFSLLFFVAGLLALFFGSYFMPVFLPMTDELVTRIAISLSFFLSGLLLAGFSAIIDTLIEIHEALKVQTNARM